MSIWCVDCSNLFSDLCQICRDKNPEYSTSYFQTKEDVVDTEEKDLWTGRPGKWECICLSLPHPHCPQHGDEYHRRNDIPNWMQVR